MPTILVTGGAGYIGSITSRLLAEKGFTPVIFDSNEFGHTEAVNGFELIQGDLRRYEDIKQAIQTVKPDAVMHFAAYLSVPESVSQPIKYYENNVLGSLNLFKAMVEAGVNKLVFSSTCATYGQPEILPVTESEKQRPESPYGQTKLAVEQMLEWFSKAYDLSSIRLRYFNVAGAWPDGSIGEDHDPEVHIIPLAIFTAMGKQNEFTIYGDDYPTPDGTNVRDYIHVVDLAQAHIDALKKLESFRGTDYYNVGVGQGYSNKEIINMIKKVSGRDFTVTVGPRRPGDASQIFADSSKIRQELGWAPRFGLEEIIESAWRWHSSHPNGYRTPTSS